MIIQCVLVLLADVLVLIQCVLALQADVPVLIQCVLTLQADVPVLIQCVLALQADVPHMPRLLHEGSVRPTVRRADGHCSSVNTGCSCSAGGCSPRAAFPSRGFGLTNGTPC
jgi:hypothetical protein